ncbi:MAG: hypothetical protein ACE149_15825 [Armatimonadota bacterium]
MTHTDEFDADFEWMEVVPTVDEVDEATFDVAAYAGAIRVDVEVLRENGVSSSPSHPGGPAVRIEYLGETGKPVAVRFRFGMDGAAQWRWGKDSKSTLYGRQWLPEARERGYVFVCDRESDAHVLWSLDEPAVSRPEGEEWQSSWSEHLEGVAEMRLISASPESEEETASWLRDTQKGDQVKLFPIWGDGVGLLEQHQQAPDRTRELLSGTATLAVSLAEWDGVRRDEKAAQEWQKCSELASDPHILDRLVAELCENGVVGEESTIKLLYLATTTRILPEPVSVAVKGPSSGGKSYLVKQVLAYFPPEAYYALTAMSERALVYFREPLQHRMLVIYEAAGLQGDIGAYLLRSLLSEHRIRYVTVAKTHDVVEGLVIEREGPTGLLLTTTEVALNPENETRLLSVTVTDTPEQTRQVLQAQAAGASSVPPTEDWIALQRWLALRECDVIVPFARALARMTEPGGVRLRRDFPKVLGLIRVHALIHQENRERQGNAVVASLEDYEAIYLLVEPLVTAGVQRSVPARVREVVEAVVELSRESGADAWGPDGVSVRQLADRLGVDDSTITRRLREAFKGRYVDNSEARRGHPFRLVPGESLPEEGGILPSPEALQRCIDADAQEGDAIPPGDVADAERELEAEVGSDDSYQDDTDDDWDLPEEDDRLWSRERGAGESLLFPCIGASGRSVL